jgi:ectoine hydroxylase-related dioxygenase (phytanoyl-CoA dioxygenase family)
MKITAEQIQQFKREGYTIVHEFFDAQEVALMRGDLERLVAEGKLRNVATEGDGATHSSTKFNLQICPLSPHSDIFRCMPFSAKVRETVRALIGDDFILQLDQIFLKPGGSGAGTNWHQDNAYFGIPDPHQGTGMWIALHDATLENGPMHIVPGSHVNLRPHERDMGSDHHICCTVDEKKDTVLPVVMKAGGALFFNYGIVHCTKGNRTNKERAGLALHFLKSEFRPNAKATAPSHPYLSGPHYTKGQAEFGVVMEGRWEKLAASTPCPA